MGYIIRIITTPVNGENCFDADNQLHLYAVPGQLSKEVSESEKNGLYQSAYYNK